MKVKHYSIEEDTTIEELVRDLREVAQALAQGRIEMKYVRKDRKGGGLPVVAELLVEREEFELPGGRMVGQPGDYAVIGTLGDMYPMKPKAFHELYEVWDGSAG